MESTPEETPRAEHVLTLEREAARLGRIFDHLPALVAFWDKDQRNVIANAAYIDWFGAAPETIRGVHIREVLGEEVYAKNLPYIEGVLAGEEQLFDRTLVDPHGRTRHSQASYVPEIVDGEVTGFLVLVTDVTPREEAQRELDDAQALAKVGSWSYYPATDEMTWSRQMFRLLGKDPDRDEASLETYLSMVHPDDLPRFLDRRAQAAQVAEEYEVDYRLVVGDDERHIRTRVRPERDASGTTVRLNGTLADETELYRATEELRLSHERLAAVNHLLSDTIALLSHDIRQPILSVTGYLELAQEEVARQPGSSPQLRTHLERADSAARRMNALVDDVLMMVNIDSGDLAVRPEHVVLSASVREVADVQPPGAAIQIDVRRDATVLADPFHVRQSVTNLVANALRYGEPPVLVRVDADSTHATISVIDHGEGVPEDFVPHLFERFSRATSGVATTKQGSGFGLYIVAQLVRGNHGDIVYSPNEPTGARFTLRLPLADPA